MIQITVKTERGYKDDAKRRNEDATSVQRGHLMASKEFFLESSKPQLGWNDAGVNVPTLNKSTLSFLKQNWLP